jgi:DnaK suppressor protein
VAVERARAQRRLSSLERTFDEMIDAADLEPPDDEHDPEGTTAYEHAQITSLAAEARTRLTQLDRASPRSTTRATAPANDAGSRSVGLVYMPSQGPHAACAALCRPDRTTQRPTSANVREPPTNPGRFTGAGWPPACLIVSYELLMQQPPTRGWEHPDR